MKLHSLAREGLAALVTALICAPDASAETITILPSRDTTLFESDPNANLGNSDLVSGTVAGGTRVRGLWEFDVAASIPAGSIIHSVLFEVGVIRQSNLNQPSAYALHAFLKDWNEGVGGAGAGSNGSPALAGETTWNSQFSGASPWSVPGGQADVEYTAVASAAGSVISSSNVTYAVASTPALVADAQAWLDDPAANHGWFFLATNEATGGSARRFSSSEAPGSGLSPRITVQFTPVPEPGVFASTLGGAVALIGLRRRR